MLRPVLGMMIVAMAAGTAQAATLDFSADTVTYSPRQENVELVGNVDVKRGEVTLRSARLVIAMVKGTAKTLTATGGASLTRPATNGSMETVKGDSAVYTPDTASVVFTGNVTLTRGSNVLRGSKLVYDVESGRASLTGGGTQVKGRFEGEAVQ